MSKHKKAAEEKKGGGITVRDVPAIEFIKAFAAHLKKGAKIELPAWHDYVKTSVAKELAPSDPDWFYIRVASVARKIYLRPGTGVGALTKVYGARNRKGVRPAAFERASGGIIRKSLQVLEQAGIVVTRNGRKGRYISPAGQKELDTIAGQIPVKRGILASMM